MELNQTGSDNIAIGILSLDAVTSSRNVAIGSNAGLYLTTGTNNTFLGYNAGINKSLYSRLVIGFKGLIQQREFIQSYFPEKQQIIFLDDDIEAIDLSLSEFKNQTLDYFFQEAFRLCLEKNSFIWGVYPVYNPYFWMNRQEVTTDLNYIVGAFYGIINRVLPSLRLEICQAGEKEDVERSIKYFIQDGIVLRYNRISFKTKYYGSIGGLGNFKSRLEKASLVCEKLALEYKQYGRIKSVKMG